MKEEKRAAVASGSGEGYYQDEEEGGDEILMEQEKYSANLPSTRFSRNAASKYDFVKVLNS